MTRILTTALLALLAAACAQQGASSAPPMSEEQMMQRMIELGTPGANHQLLDPMVGTFKASGQFWSAPGTEPAPGEGVSYGLTWRAERPEATIM